MLFYGMRVKKNFKSLSEFYKYRKSGRPMAEWVTIVVNPHFPVLINPDFPRAARIRPSQVSDPIPPR